MTRVRSFARPVLAAAICFAALLALTAPAGAITGGAEDSANTYSNVGMVVFYQPDGRFRCSGTLIAPRVFLTAAHCTFQDIGQVAVTFDWEISRTEPESEVDIPRAADDSGPDGRDSADGVHRERTSGAGVRGRADLALWARRSPTRTTATSPTSRTGTTPAS